MSKKKNQMTPAEVANQLGAFIAKQEETLRKYPVGPMANAARANLQKGRAAVEALKGQNESMRTQMPKQGAPGQMPLGGETLDAALAQLTPAQRSMYDSYIAKTGATPDVALAVVSVSDKESSGDHTRVERDYSKTSNERIKKIFSRTKDMSDEELNKLKADPKAFFDLVYDGRIGNGKGEGYKYRGRGMIQLTGKENYRKASQAIYGDDRLVDTPDLILEDPKIAGEVATWFMTKGRGVGAVAGVDLTDPNLTPEQIGAVVDSSYAVVAGTNNLAKAQERELFAEGTARQHDFLGKLNIESVPTTQSEYRADNAASPQAVQAEAERREQATLDAEAQETLNLLQNLTGGTQIPEEAQMRADGLNRGYLGGVYGQDATRVDMPVPDFGAMQLADDRAGVQYQRDTTQSPELQARINMQEKVNVLAEDFSYDEVAAWGKETYGVSMGQENSRGGNTDNQIIGANLYSADRGHLIYSEESLDKLGGAGATVDETRILLQALKNNGLSKDQAFEALSDPDTYRELKQTIPNTLTFGTHTYDMLKETAEAADVWARTTDNREALATVVDRGEEGGADYFQTELAPGVNAEVSQRDALIERDKQAFLSKNPGRMYTIGAGGLMTPGQIDPTSTRARQISTAQATAENPNDFREEPTFLDRPMPEVLKADDAFIPEDKIEDGVTQVPDVVVPEKPEEPVETPKAEDTPAVQLPRKEITTDAEPDKVAFDPNKNLSVLMGVPAMAALAEVNSQRRALEQMRGPATPVLTDIPQFSYQSNIGQQMMDVRNATNAAMRGEGMSDTARAAMRGNLLAQRFNQEARLRAADNQQKQAAKARYDQMALQARMTQDALRNKYAEDSINFNNRKAMLEAQLRAQPLNVLASSTQDYLKNIYAPNVAAQMEGIGRQFDTGAIDTSQLDE